MPLEFAKSIKVVVRAREFYFYQINYLQYEAGVAARTFQPGDTIDLPRPDVADQTVTARHVLNPGQSATIFETKQPGRITSLKLGPAEAFSGKDRALVLRIYWDGADRPAVEVPAGDFFGYSFGQPAVSLALAALLPLAWRGTGEKSWTAAQKARHAAVIGVFVLFALLATLRGSIFP